MAACSHQLQFVIDYAANKQPVGANVAISVSAPIAYQRVISIPAVQWFLLSKGLNHHLQLRQVSVLPCHSFGITSKSCGLPNFERHGSTLPVREEVIG